MLPPDFKIQCKCHWIRLLWDFWYALYFILSYQVQIAPQVAVQDLIHTGASAYSGPPMYLSYPLCWDHCKIPLAWVIMAISLPPKTAMICGLFLMWLGHYQPLQGDCQSGIIYIYWQSTQISWIATLQVLGFLTHDMLLSATVGTEPSPALLVSTSCRRNKRSSSDVPHSSESAPTLCAEGHESSEPSKSSGKKATCKEKAGKAFYSHNSPSRYIKWWQYNLFKVTHWALWLNETLNSFFSWSRINILSASSVPNRTNICLSSEPAALKWWRWNGAMNN